MLGWAGPGKPMPLSVVGATTRSDGWGAKTPAAQVERVGAKGDGAGAQAFLCAGCTALSELSVPSLLTLSTLHTVQNVGTLSDSKNQP